MCSINAAKWRLFPAVPPDVTATSVIRNNEQKLQSFPPGRGKREKHSNSRGDMVRDVPINAIDGAHHVTPGVIDL